VRPGLKEKAESKFSPALILKSERLIKPLVANAVPLFFSTQRAVTMNNIGYFSCLLNLNFST
jgi:hypothetical protein